MDTIDEFFAMMDNGMSEEDELREIVRQTAFLPPADGHWQRIYREANELKAPKPRKVRAVRRHTKCPEAVAARIKVNEAYARLNSK